jgi:hypothetical protein
MSSFFLHLSWAFSYNESRRGETMKTITLFILLFSTISYAQDNPLQKIYSCVSKVKQQHDEYIRSISRVKKSSKCKADAALARHNKRSDLRKWMADVTASYRKDKPFEYMGANPEKYTRAIDKYKAYNDKYEVYAELDLNSRENMELVNSVYESAYALKENYDYESRKGHNVSLQVYLYNKVPQMLMMSVALSTLSVDLSLSGFTADDGYGIEKLYADLEETIDSCSDYIREVAHSS